MSREVIKPYLNFYEDNGARYFILKKKDGNFNEVKESSIVSGGLNVQLPIR